jgi:apolipoprotein N-acyltransferase
MAPYMSKPHIQYLLAALSGILTALSFPETSLGWLAFIAPVPLVLAASWARRDRDALLMGWLAATITWLINVPWVIPVMSKHGGLPYPLGVLIYVAMALYLGIFGALFSWLVFRVAPRQGEIWRWLAIPAAWISVEYARTWLLTGFPWHLIAEALIDLPELAMPVRWIGPYGVGFLTVLVAAFLARCLWGLIESRTATPFLLVAAILLGGWFGVGRAMLVSARLSLAGETKLTAAAIQPDIEQEVRWDPSRTFEIFDGLVEQTEEAIDKGASLVVWPESTVPMLYEETPFWRDWVESTTRRTGVDIILGSVARSQSGDRFTNSALLVRNGATAGRYDKIRLVPFGEYVPMKRALFFAEKLVRAVGDFEFGNNPGPLDGRVPYGLAICYEVVYPSIPVASVRLGAELLVTITNDAWFDVSAAPYQHLSMARMRAIETDRWIVRAGTTGISAIVDPTGRLVSHIPLGERGVLVGEVGVRKSVTPYTRWGDWAAWLCVLLTLVALGMSVRTRRDDRAAREL